MSSVPPRRVVAAPTPRVARSERNRVVTLRAVGDLDITCSPRLAVDAGTEIRAGRDVVVDLTEVTFMDSTGAASLVNAVRRATRAGVGFAVVCPGGQPHRAMTTMRLLDTLNVAPDEAQALARMRPFCAAPTAAR